MADTNSDAPNANVDPSAEKASNPPAATAGKEETVTNNNVAAESAVQPGQQIEQQTNDAGTTQVTDASTEAPKPAEPEQPPQPQPPAEPDLRPAVLIIGGLGGWPCIWKGSNDICADHHL